MPIKRIRFEQSVLDSKQLKPGEDFSKLPDIISIIYLKEPLAKLDNGQPVANLVLCNKIDDKIIDNGIRAFEINERKP